MEVRDKIKAFLGKFFDVGKVGEADNIFEKGLVNSLFAMQLVSFVETEFDITVDNNELNLDNFKNINSICSLVEGKLI